MRRLIDGFKKLFGASSLQKPHYQIVVHELAEGPFQIEGRDFESLSLPPAGNQGLRFTYRGRRYAITGDSTYHEQERAFLRGIDLAIIDSGHLSDDEIVALAVASQPGTIVCSHLYREIDASRLQALAEKEGYRGTILVGRDLMTFVL